MFQKLCDLLHRIKCTSVQRADRGTSKIVTTKLYLKSKPISIHNRCIRKQFLIAYKINPQLLTKIFKGDTHLPKNVRLT